MYLHKEYSIGEPIIHLVNQSFTHPMSHVSTRQPSGRSKVVGGSFLSDFLNTGLGPKCVCVSKYH